MTDVYILTMPRGFDRERTNVHKLQYHFIWCPKYRKSVLEGEVRDRLEALIEEKADELGLEILELAIRPDHVHLFITGDPTLAPNKIMQQVKGYSSRHLRDQFNSVCPRCGRARTSSQVRATYPARSSRSTSTPKQVNNDATDRLNHGAGQTPFVDQQES